MARQRGKWSKKGWKKGPKGGWYRFRNGKKVYLSRYNVT